jgi:GNAT superfamily N-acetyltransferase
MEVTTNPIYVYSAHEPRESKESDLRIELATTSDVAQIVDIINKAFRAGETYRVPGTYVRTNTEEVQKDVEGSSPAKRCYVLRGRVSSDSTRDEILGTATLTLVNGQEAEFGRFAMRTDLHGKQLGKRLMAALEQTAKNEGRTRMLMMVASLNSRLVKVYQERGFELTGFQEETTYGHTVRPECGTLYFVQMAKNL